MRELLKATLFASIILGVFTLLALVPTIENLFRELGARSDAYHKAVSAMKQAAKADIDALNMMDKTGQARHRIIEDLVYSLESCAKWHNVQQKQVADMTKEVALAAGLNKEQVRQVINLLRVEEYGTTQFVWGGLAWARRSA